MAIFNNAGCTSTKYVAMRALPLFGIRRTDMEQKMPPGRPKIPDSQRQSTAPASTSGAFPAL